MTRRLDPGAVLSRVFTIYGQQAAVLIPAALLLFLPIALLSGAVDSGGEARPGAVLLVLILGIVGTFWFQGVVVEAVRDIRDGRRDVSLGGLFRATAPVLGPLIAVGLLAGLGIALGFVALFVPGLYLLTLWAVVAPVVVIERPGIGAAFGRSRELVRGNGWQVFAVLVLVFLLQLVASAILGAVFGNDTFTGGFLASIIGQSLVAPLGAIAAAVMYYDLRELRETPGAGAELGQAAPLAEQPLSERPGSQAPPGSQGPPGWSPPVAPPAPPPPERRPDEQPPGNLPTE
jgi:hypothetical protein